MMMQIGPPTRLMLRLMEAILCSLKVITAWDNGSLIGLIRAVGDGKILVMKAYCNSGVGSQLLSMLLSKYSDDRQKVLLTNDLADVRAFYEMNEFSSCDKGDLVSFVKFE